MEVGDVIKCVKQYKSIDTGESCKLVGNIMSESDFFVRGEQSLESVSGKDLYEHFVLEKVCNRSQPIVFRSHL